MSTNDTKAQISLFDLPLVEPVAAADRKGGDVAEAQPEPAAQPEPVARAAVPEEAPPVNKVPAPRSSRSKAAPPPAKRSAQGRHAKVPPPKQSLSGLVPEGDVRLTANIRQDLHLKLKIAAAHRRTTIGELVEELVEKYL